MIKDILAFNEAFVTNESYKMYETDKFPGKKIAIVSCMDTRLIELLPAALGIKNGDAKIIKNAGGIISHPFGSAMRSLLIGIYELEIEEIFVIGHTDCGARITDSAKIVEKMTARGIHTESIDMIKYYGVDFEQWLGGFMDLEQSIMKSVEMIRNHPLVPAEIQIYGLIIDSQTGKLTLLERK